MSPSLLVNLSAWLRKINIYTINGLRMAIWKFGKVMLEYGNLPERFAGQSRILLSPIQVLLRRSRDVFTGDSIGWEGMGRDILFVGCHVFLKLSPTPSFDLKNDRSQWSRKHFVSCP